MAILVSLSAAQLGIARYRVAAAGSIVLAG
jgi:hypothetical protein